MIRINLANGGHQFRGGGENPRRIRSLRQLRRLCASQRANGQQVRYPSHLQTSLPSGAGLLDATWFHPPQQRSKAYMTGPLWAGVAFVAGFGGGASWVLMLLARAAS